MNNALQVCADRITAAIEYLKHEADPIRAITLAEQQLQQAQISLTAGRGDTPTRRTDDRITFDRADKVPRNPWPPMASGRELLEGMLRVECPEAR